MFRSIPVSNKLCFDKELKRSWQIHEKKLRELKKSVDQNKPTEFSFLYSRPKREELQELRNCQIMRQNRALIGKINQIAQEGDVSKFLRKSKSMHPQNLKKTLNQPFRKRQLAKIVEDNQEMLKRLQQKKSCYNNRTMARQRQAIEKNIHLISSYPYKNFRENKTQVNLWMKDCMTPKNKTNRTLQTANSSKSNSFFQLSLRKTKTIEGSHFLVTVNSSKNKKFIIKLENLERLDEKFGLQFPQTQARKFLRTHYDNDIDKMLDSLVMDPNDRSFYLRYETSKNPIQQLSNKLPRIKESYEQANEPVQQSKISNHQNQQKDFDTSLPIAQI